MQAWCLASEGFSFHVRKCSMAGEHPCHSHSSPDFCSHSPLHTLIHTPCSQDWSTAPGRGTRGTWVSVCEQMNGDGKYTVQINLHLCHTTTLPTGGWYDVQVPHWHSWHTKASVPCSCLRSLHRK